MNYDSEEMRETILRMMTSGYYQYELPRFSKERDSINNALVKIMSEAKRMRFIESTGVLSRAQLDDVTNGIYGFLTIRVNDCLKQLIHLFLSLNVLVQRGRLF